MGRRQQSESSVLYQSTLQQVHIGKINELIVNQLVAYNHVAFDTRHASYCRVYP